MHGGNENGFLCTANWARTSLGMSGERGSEQEQHGGMGWLQGSFTPHRETSAVPATRVKLSQPVSLNFEHSLDLFPLPPPPLILQTIWGLDLIVLILIDSHILSPIRVSHYMKTWTFECKDVLELEYICAVAGKETNPVLWCTIQVLYPVPFNWKLGGRACWFCVIKTKEKANLETLCHPFLLILCTVDSSRWRQESLKSGVDVSYYLWEGWDL